MTRDPQNPDQPSGFTIAQKEDWTVKMWTNKVSYLMGELVLVEILSNKPAKLASLVNLGASENENTLLPEDADVLAQSGEILILPGKDDLWKLVAAVKTGKDVIKAKLAAEDGTELELALEVTVEGED
jgi:hypothetical protein